MKLTAVENVNFPPLAWLAECRMNGGVFVCHGALVEAGDDFFVEGVWNNKFSDAAFDRTDCFFGSGGRIVDGGLTIVPSASTVDYCYYSTCRGGAKISNSLPLLLASLGDELDPHCTSYSGVNDSILKGINAYESRLPTKNGEVRRLLYRNLRLVQGEIFLIDKPMPPHFASFLQYKAYLADNYALIVANARDADRSRPIRIASTQSKGYDSTAINAIAIEHGIDQVFSIAKGKAHGKFADQDEDLEVDDGGGEIGVALGFECTFIDRRALREQPQYEYLYYASLHASEDTCLAGINSHICSPSLLLIGSLGEITAPWDYYYRYYGRSESFISDLERADHGGNALGEVRLKVGFITVPLFYIGARQRRDILNICNGSEMDSWRMYNNYVRPIARRIAEESGVPRTYFGQKKNAIAMVFTPPRLPVGRDLREEYMDFLDQEGMLPKWKWAFLPLVHGINRLFWFASPKQHLWLYYLQRLLTRIKGREHKWNIVWRDLDNVFYCFCVNKRTKEYSQMIGASPSQLYDRNKT